MSRAGPSSIISRRTEGQVERLEQIFGLCGLKPSDKTCPAEEDMKEAKEPVVLDASMIADAQAVVHYEIARYGTLITYQLGMSDAARLL
jgi:ferritin-like metal-binding protein YciE